MKGGWRAVFEFALAFGLVACCLLMVAVVVITGGSR
jgi:hypothetical protein